MNQQQLFSAPKNGTMSVPPFKTQLLKWVGNKQRFAHEIISFFPSKFGRYFEPFLGSGAVLGTLSPKHAVASDACEPLVGIWDLLRTEPEELLASYTERWHRFQKDRDSVYEEVKASFNAQANAHDLFFLARSCYAGIIRFRKDGYMSTPIGVHKPVSPDSVANRIELWRERTKGTEFRCCDFEETIASARKGDVVYCDPPYSDTQAILYGAQAFTLERLFAAIEGAKRRGAFVVLSIDGKKKSGRKKVDLPIPDGLFETQGLVSCGRSMLRRFQMEGQTLESEMVADRLLLTWST